MKDVSKSKYLLRAFGIALIVYGALNFIFVGHIVFLLFTLPSLRGTSMRVSVAVSVAQCWFALFSGILILVRQNRMLLAFGLWSVALIAGDIVSFVDMFGWSLSTIRFQALYFFRALSFLAAFVYLLCMRNSWDAKTSVPLCTQCHYDLRGLNEPRCPECGRVYTLDEFYQL